MAKNKKNANSAQKHWDFLERIARATGHTKGEVAYAWRTTGLSDFRRLKGIRAFAGYQVISMRTLIEDSIKAKSNSKKVMLEGTSRTKFTQVQPAPAKVSDVLPPEPVRAYTFEVVYEGNPGSFVSMLLALSNVKSISTERD